MESARNPIIGALVLAVLFGTVYLVGKSYDDRRDRLESLCYDASVLHRSFEDELVDNEIENAEQILGLVLNSSDGRTLSEVAASMDRLCYELGAEYS